MNNRRDWKTAEAILCVNGKDVLIEVGLCRDQCTLCRPHDILCARPGVRSTSACSAFLLVLSSIFGGPFLDRLRRSFSRFVVRRCRRYYELICPPRFIVRQAQLGLLAFMSDFPPEAFSDRSVLWCDCHTVKTETNRTSRFSRLECPRMHRFVDSAVSAPISPIAIAAVLPSPCQDRIGTRKW